MAEHRNERQPRVLAQRPKIRTFTVHVMGVGAVLSTFSALFCSILTTQGGSYSHHPHFYQETEVQRGLVTCLRPHRQQATKSAFEVKCMPLKSGS